MAGTLAERTDAIVKRYKSANQALVRIEHTLNVTVHALVSQLRTTLDSLDEEVASLRATVSEYVFPEFIERLKQSREYRHLSSQCGDIYPDSHYLRICTALLENASPLSINEIRERCKLDNLSHYLLALREAKLIVRVGRSVKAQRPYRLTSSGNNLLKKIHSEAA